MRKRDPKSLRSAAREKRRKNIEARFVFYLRGGFDSDEVLRFTSPRPWNCTHLECTAFERWTVKTARRPRTVPPPAVVLAAAKVLKALHPEHHFPLRAALAWRFGVSAEAVRKALQAARRLDVQTP